MHDPSRRPERLSNFCCRCRCRSWNLSIFRIMGHPHPHWRHFSPKLSSISTKERRAEVDFPSECTFPVFPFSAGTFLWTIFGLTCSEMEGWLRSSAALEGSALCVSTRFSRFSRVILTGARIGTKCLRRGGFVLSALAPFSREECLSVEEGLSAPFAHR